MRKILALFSVLVMILALPTAVAQAKPTLGDYAEQAVEAAKEKLPEIAQKTKETGKKAVAKAKEKAPEVKQKVKKKTSEVKTKVKEEAPKVKEKVKKKAKKAYKKVTEFRDQQESNFLDWYDQQVEPKYSLASPGQPLVAAAGVTLSRADVENESAESETKANTIIQALKDAHSGYLVLIVVVVLIFIWAIDIIQAKESQR